ncbi:hypothetical protein FDECE_11331 [Fusarium decemcellulare]|nr:hypothetical protein FDECE_11331 [Fusarium decemcellulare]
MEKPSDLWKRARQSLPQESQAWLSQLDQLQGAPTPANEDGRDRIIRLTIEKQAAVEAQRSKLTVKVGSRKWELKKYFDSIVKWLDKFKTIGDAAMAYDPGHAALPWAAFRFVLQAVVAEHEHTEATLRILATTPRLLFFGQILETVYLRDKMIVSEAYKDQALYQRSLDHLQDDLVILYTGVLSALEYCYTMFTKKKVYRKLVAIFTSSEPNEILKKLDAYEKNVMGRGEDCERLCSHRMSAHSIDLLQELRASMAGVHEQVLKVLVRLEDDEKNKTFRAISDIPFRSHHAAIHEERTEGTCGWVLEREEFKDWKSSESSVAVLYGSAGSGKTFVISKVIDHILSQAKPDEAVAYFYCNREESDRRNPAHIFPCLVRQLSSSRGECGSIHRVVKDRASQLVEGSSAFTVRQSIDLINDIIGDYSSTTIIIDALDECERERLQLMMSSLDRLMAQRNRLKVFISSRRDDDIRLHFQSRPVIEMTATDSQDDIVHFVDSKLHQNPHWEGLSDELRDMIRQELVRGAEGMFLWVSLKIYNLSQSKLWTESNIRERLAFFPPDLKGAYDLIWEKIESMPHHEKELVMRAFAWVLCSFHPLNTQALSMAMSIDPESDQIDDLTLNLDESVMSGLVENLLVYDKQLNMWRFTHLSALEYYEKYHCSMQEARFFVAMASLKFLTTDPCKEKKTTCGCGGQSQGELSQAPACEFVRIHVFKYLQEAERTNLNYGRMDVLLERFLGSPQSSSMAYRGWAQRCGNVVLKDNKVLMPFASPLIAMAVFGLFNLARGWWEGSETGPHLHIRNDQGLSLQKLAKDYRHGDIEAFLTHQMTQATNKGHHLGPSSLTHGRDSVTRPPTLGFLFVVNQLMVELPEMDIYNNHIPPSTPHGYKGEIPSPVMRYRDGDISRTTGYQWHRDTTSLPAQGQLLCADGSGSWTRDATGNLWGGQEYKTFSVFACNPLLPIMVAEKDPLAASNTGSWELLRVFHPRTPELAGISQVVTMSSPMGEGGSPVRYVAGRRPSWIPSLLPRAYRSPMSSAPPSRGLGGELPIILGLMALSSEPDKTGSAVEEVFLGSNGHGKKWRPNGEWRGLRSPKGYPETAQDDPRGFVIKVFYDPENPTPQEMLHWFEWQTAVVRESSN